MDVHLERKQRPPKEAGKLVLRENCRKIFRHFLPIFDVFSLRAKFEKCRKYFRRFLTFFSRGPFPLAPFAVRSADESPERGYIRMFPRNETGTKVRSHVPPERKTGTRAHSPKPPCCETTLLCPLDSNRVLVETTFKTSKPLF